MVRGWGRGGGRLEGNVGARAAVDRRPLAEAEVGVADAHEQGHARGAEERLLLRWGEPGLDVAAAVGRGLLCRGGGG